MPSLYCRPGAAISGGKKIFDFGEKYYFEDPGIRHAWVGFRGSDIHKILENIGFMHHKASGYAVPVGQLGKKEVDFVCDKAGERMYVQLADTIADDKVRVREFGH